MEWISTKIEFPPYDTEVIICTTKFVTVGELSIGDDFRYLAALGVIHSTDYIHRDQVTHWMPLPENPNK